MFFFRYTIQIMVKKVFLFAPLQLSNPPSPQKILGRKNIGGAFLAPRRLRLCLCSAAT